MQTRESSVTFFDTAEAYGPFLNDEVWLLAQKPWIVPIPGTTKRHRLEENLGAPQVELTTGDLAEIESALSAITVHGERYPEQMQLMAGR
ncbi:MAG TPA: aldo/keto reductase [Oleiagrimonas sp.]|nr:aldo/keto reductase [Oleiagrimonas sp.]